MSILVSEEFPMDTAPAFSVRLLRVLAFRNHACTEIEFEPGFNVLHGPNAAGKTSLLEALHLISTSKLLRGSRDSEAIRHGSDQALVEVELSGTKTLLGVAIGHGMRKRATLNSMNLPRAADLIGRLPCVCFTAADLPIVAEQPSDRRMFLDMELSQLYPEYIRALTVYKRALEQRNALLRAAQERPQSDPVFEAWETEIATSGQKLRSHRHEFVGSLRQLASTHHAALAEGEVIDLTMQASDECDSAESFFSHLGRTRGHDIARGSTSIGPHRDELLITINGMEARLYGSQGQQRTAILSMKLAVLDLAAERHRATPLLLLDDIFSDLDKGRRTKLIETVLTSSGQVVITCTDREQTGEEIGKQSRHFRVEAGTVLAG